MSIPASTQQPQQCVRVYAVQGEAGIDILIHLNISDSQYKHIHLLKYQTNIQKKTSLLGKQSIIAISNKLQNYKKIIIKNLKMLHEDRHGNVIKTKKQTQQQQLQQILDQTFKSSGYCDEDIGQFINDKSGSYQEMFSKQKLDKNSDKLKDSNQLHSFTRKSSQEQSDGVSIAYRESFGSMEDQKQQNNSQQDKSIRKRSQSYHNVQNMNLIDSSMNSDTPSCFQRLDKYYQNKKKIFSLSQIKQKYPFFVISNPNYTLNKSYEESLFQYNTLKNVNIQVMDIGFCTIADNYKVCMGTDDGRVAIFQKTYSKPVHIFQAFNIKKKKKQSGQGLQNQIPKVTSIRWSQNLQYLAIGSSTRELKVYQFKQTITIENKNILRLLKEPIQIISLTQKQIKNIITSIKFLSQVPFLAVLNDLNDDMQLLEYKLHIMSYRPYLSLLPLKFNDVFNLQLINFTVGGNKTKNHIKTFNNNQEEFFISTSNKKSQIQEEQEGTLIAIGSQQYVTIALIKPYFEVIMVYDKEKHGKNIKKQGYSHISFRKNPLGILIVWDKYAQLLSIQISSLSPLKSRISNSGSQLMPQTTLLAGLITDTLVYQISESGIKIYATANFGEEKNSNEYKQCIYERFINFFELPLGLQIQQQLTQSTPTLSLLRMLNSYVKCCHGWFFITTNTSLLGVRIQKFQQLIRNTIENVNNWKIGLQLLHDGYKGLYKNYDNMTKQVIIKNIHQYTFKYINFLNMVIGSSNQVQVSEKQRLNKRQLWYQQITFLLNILIQTSQFEYIFNKILPKLINNNLQEYINCLEPFIMLHKINIINSQGLEVLFKFMKNKQSISTLLIANILPQLNEIDLPHMLNNIILQNSMYQDMVFINMLFEDYFTAFAVMVGYYRVLCNTQILNLNNSPHTDLLIQFKKRNSGNQMQEEKISEKDNEQKNKNKQRIRQLIVYFILKMLKKINGIEEVSYLNNNQRKKKMQRYKEFLQVFLPLFQSSIIYIILDDKQTQKIMFEYIIPEMFRGKCLELINAISNKCFNSDLMTDIIMGIPIDKVQDLRSYWICLIGLYNKSVIKIDVFLGLKFLVNEQKSIQQKQSQKLTTSIKPLSEQKKNKQIKIRYQHIKKQMIQQFIRETVQKSTHKLNQQFKKLSPQLLQNFYNELLSNSLSLSFQSSHISLLRTVSFILGSGFYIKVIHAMMVDKQSQSGLRKNHKKEVKQVYNVYNYIEQTITNYNKNQKEQLRKIIFENIQYFIELDCQKLCDIIIKYYLQSIDKFVSYCLMSMSVGQNLKRSSSLQNYNGVMIGSNNAINLNNNGICVHQNLLIKLIEGLLLRLQSSEIQTLKIDKFQPNSQWMLQLRLKYLRLLAVTGRHNQIIQEIKKQNYPLDSSLQICRKYGVIDAQAYLLVKSGGQGQIASAIRLYFTLISQKIKMLTPESLPQFKDYFISIIRQCIRVCEGLHGDAEHFNQQWFMISEELNDLKLGIYRILPAYTCDLLCDVIDKQVYPILSEKIVKKENCDGIINYFQQNMQNLDLVFIRALLHQILKNYAFHKVMYLLTQQSYITSQIKQRKEISIKTGRGFLTTCTCYLCHQQNGILIHYNNCGHQIHPSCGQDVKICVICSCRQEKLIEKQIDLMKKIKPELYSQDNQLPILPEVQVKKQNRMELLKKFDQRKIDIVYV